MKLFMFLAMTILSCNSIFAKTKIYYIGDIQAKANQFEIKDLKKFMNLMKWEPSHKDLDSGKQIFKVLSVVKGSVYERKGIVAGDFFFSGKSNKLGDVNEILGEAKGKRATNEALIKDPERIGITKRLELKGKIIKNKN